MRRLTTKVLFVLALVTMAVGIAWAAINWHDLMGTISGNTLTVTWSAITGLGNDPSISKVEVTLGAGITCTAGKNQTSTSGNQKKTKSFAVTNGNSGPGSISLSCPGNQTLTVSGDVKVTATVNGLEVGSQVVTITP